MAELYFSISERAAHGGRTFMSRLKEQNRLTHEFCRGELSHFLHITACAFAALAVIGLVLGWFARICAAG